MGSSTSRYRWVLVSAHERSGTHFMIDSLVLNHPRLRFPGSSELPKDFNLGSLLRNDPRLTAVFARLLGGEHPVVIKCDLRASDLSAAMDCERLDSGVKGILRAVYDEALKVYVWRDPRDVLVSFYHYSGYQGEFTTFLRAPNRNCLRYRGLLPEGSVLSHVDYLAAHVTEGLRPAVHDVVVRYEDLNAAHELTMQPILRRISGEPIADGVVRRPRKMVGRLYLARRWLWRRGLIKRIEYSGLDNVRRRSGSWREYFTAEDLRYLTGRYPAQLLTSFP